MTTIDLAPTTPERSRALTIAALGAPSWKTSVTLVAYLLRSFASRVRASLATLASVRNWRVAMP